jgi:hypothetical protein
MDRNSEVSLRLQAKNNFEWRWYCNEMGITRNDLKDVFAKTERMIVIAGLIIALTFF